MSADSQKEEGEFGNDKGVVERDEVEWKLRRRSASMPCKNIFLQKAQSNFNINNEYPIKYPIEIIFEITFQQDIFSPYGELKLEIVLFMHK